jgi:hypothetical protein
MIVNNHIDQEDLALFAMHLLGDAEANRVQAHLDECEGCCDLAALLRGDLAALALTTEMQAPPAVAKQRLMTQVTRERKVVAIDRVVHAEAGSPLANRLLVEDVYVPLANSGSKIIPWISWVGWAVAAALTVSVVDLYRERDGLQAAIAQQAGEMQSISVDAERGRVLMQTLTDPSAVRVTLNQTPVKAAPQGRAAYVAAKGSLIFTASNLEPLKPFKTYELWLLPADGKSPVPAGTFQPDLRGNASVIMPTLPAGINAKGFAITIENEGGSPTPTTPIVMSGL